MCCCNLTSRGSASNCISGRASVPFSQALGGCTVAQPPAPSANATIIIAIRRTPSPLTRRRQQRSYRCFARGFAFVAKSRFDLDHASAAVDEKGARHAGHGVGKRRRTLGIVDNREAGGICLQEALGVGAQLVDIDRHDGKAALTVALLQLIHPREGAPARSTPRCPKVDVDDLSAKLLEHDRPAVCARQRTTRRGITDIDRRDGRREEQERKQRRSACQRSLRGVYWHTVPGARNTWRMIAFVCDTPSTPYANCALFPSLKVIVAVPTWRNVAPPGLPIGGNGTALNGGPAVVRNNPPV